MNENQTAKKILIVEDDEMIADIYQRQLEKGGYEVKVVKDGQAATNEVQKHRPDLVLLDMVMPGMDGIGILETLKKGENMKVIVFSNIQDKDKEKEALEKGADAFLIKAHHTPAQLTEEIKKII